MSKYTKENLEKLVKESESYSDLCRKVGIKPTGGNFRTLKYYILMFELSIGHFQNKPKSIAKKKELKEILKEDVFYSSHKLKLRLIKEGLKERKCEICNLTNWMEHPISLELHHKNGNNLDNRIENIEIICPNCHANTDFYRGKNKAVSASFEKKRVECGKLKETLMDNATGNLEPSQINNLEGAETKHRTPKSIKICKNCGIKLSHNDKFCSTECYRDFVRKENNIPKVPELLEKFKELHSFIRVGKFYNVSDNAVKKWCIRYGILDMVKK